MPRYFFHTADHVVHRDLKGQEHPDENAARAAAVSLVGAFLTENPAALLDSHNFRVDVTDEQEVTLITLLTVAIDGPAHWSAASPEAASGSQKSPENVAVPEY